MNTMNKLRTEAGRRMLRSLTERVPGLNVAFAADCITDIEAEARAQGALHERLISEGEEAARTADRPSLREAALEHIILDGGLRLPDFDHWRERASSKPSDPDDVRWDCSCGYSGSPEKVRRHWAALRQALEDDGT